MLARVGGLGHGWQPVRGRDPEQQDAALEAAVADFVARTRGRVAFRGQSRVVVITRRPVNHVLHLVLTVVTGGFWLVPWLLLTFRGGEDAHTITVAGDGATTVTRQGARVTTGRVRGIRVAGSALGLVSVVLSVVTLAGGLPRLTLLLWLVLLDVAFAVVLLDIRRYGVGHVVPDVRPRGRPG